MYSWRAFVGCEEQEEAWDGVVAVMFDVEEEEEGCWWRNCPARISLMSASGRSRNFLRSRGEFVLPLVMMMMGDAGVSAVEGSEVV